MNDGHFKVIICMLLDRIDNAADICTIETFEDVNLSCRS